MKGQATCMQEVVDPLGLPEAAIAAVLPVLVMVVRLRLRELVLMVRERQIRTAGVDVHGLPQHLARHGRALYVPACTVQLAEGQGPAAHCQNVSGTATLRQPLRTRDDAFRRVRTSCVGHASVSIYGHEMARA